MRTKPASGLKVMSALLSPLPGKAEEFLQTLQSLRGAIRSQPGCIDCLVGRTEDDRVLLFMVWRDLPHLEAHLDSEPFRILLGATSILSAPAGFRFIATDALSFMQGTLAKPGRTPLPPGLLIS